MAIQTYSGTRFRGAQEAVFGYARELAILPPSATTIADCPQLIHAGYYDVGGIDLNENASGIESAGTYRTIQLTKGRREPSYRNNFRLGDIEFMKFAIRNSGFGADGLAQYKCLPLIAVAGGAVEECAISGFSSDFAWVGRYGMIREVSISFQDGPSQPVTASVEVWPLVLQTNADALTRLSELVTGVGGGGTIDDQEDLMREAGGSILMWQHASWLIADTPGPGATDFTDYRDIVASATVRITNNLERMGTRKPLGGGDANDLSRCAVAIMPLQESVQIEFQLHDKLPAKFINAANDSNLWGEIRLVASDGTKTMTIIVAESRLQRIGLNQIGPGSVIRFSASAVSRKVAIVTGYP